VTDDVEKALEGAAAEDTVQGRLLYTTGNRIGGRPQIITLDFEVTLSGLMEIQAILERGGLVEPGNVVNEAEAAILPILDGGAPVLLARDIVGVLAERGLLRKGA
jgi:hypothetical protein